MSDDTLVTALEQATILYQEHLCDLRIPAPVLLIIVLQVQLAMKHPQNTGTTFQYSRDFVDQTREMFREKGMTAFAEAIDHGRW